MIAPALYVFAGCALCGGIQQIHLSIMLTGGRSVSRLLLAGMWFTVAILAIAGSMAFSGQYPQITTRIIASTQFLLWPMLIWLMIVLTNSRISVIPIVLTGIWLFLLLVSFQAPIENLYIALPKSPLNTNSGINEWWYAAYFAIMLTIFFCLLICYRFYYHGDKQASRVLTGLLVLLLETSIFDLLVMLRLIESPTVTVFGFFIFLAILSYYLSPRLQSENERAGDPGTHEQALNTDPDDRLIDIYKTFKEIQIYSGMGIRRLSRNATNPEKLNALFERVNSDASTELKRLEEENYIDPQRTLKSHNRPDIHPDTQPEMPK
ncbi:MAG: hypothetical protein V3W04_11455 [Gammaproteobacteria bacterium]